MPCDARRDIDGIAVVICSLRERDMPLWGVRFLLCKSDMSLCDVICLLRERDILASARDVFRSAV